MLGGARVDGAVSVVPSAVVRTAVIWTERGEGEREKTRTQEDEKARTREREKDCGEEKRG